MGGGGKLELCRIKRTGTTKYAYWAKQGGSLSWVRSSVMRCLISSLHCRLLTCFFLPVWQDLVQFSGTRFGVISRSWQGLFQVYQQILASPLGCNAVGWQREVFCGLDSCYSLCVLHSSSALIPLTLYLDADILLLLPALLSNLCWELRAHLVPSLLGSWSLCGPKRASAGSKCIWQQVPGRWWQCLTKALPTGACGVFHCWGRWWVFHK